eukprot:CAMPEP_0118851118 /NCGR_PEP_ID=MMETSP1163-20130328/677_1 /TAXON_ID=124430 /ORGANISM="Phaeomonas parva, Strain CCMP2877" /LENGTH=389 /DNA_ID=CAMNT_0006783395 /DNA_START=195 /DNA_END=1364 /DNA_ORIENTATION=-
MGPSAGDKDPESLAPLMKSPTGDRGAGAATAAPAPPAKGEDDGAGSTGVLLFCFMGLQVAYISWGVIQERMMTEPYTSVAEDGTRVEGIFPSVIFLVAANRALALCVAAVLMTRDTKAKTSLTGSKESLLDAGTEGMSAPALWLTRLTRIFLTFGPSSLSNVMSSFFQYKALVFVSFPTQVLFKANKIIPNMLMGKALQRRTYPWRDYGEALLISLSVATFMLFEKDGGKGGEDAGSALVAFGILCLTLYLAFDAFTSQWQSRVFNNHCVSQYQMMFGVNFCSLIITSGNLLLSGGLWESLLFVQQYPESLTHIVLFSLASCIGQLFIFYTIKTFGPVMFSIIMTTRQVLSMVVSYILFGHAISFVGAGAAGMVFCVLGGRIRRRSQKK